MEASPRKATQADFKGAKRYGLEVFRDENNGNLIYVCETGALAVVPGAAVPGGKIKDPSPSTAWS